MHRELFHTDWCRGDLSAQGYQLVHRISLGKKWALDGNRLLIPAGRAVSAVDGSFAYPLIDGGIIEVNISSIGGNAGNVPIGSRYHPLLSGADAINVELGPLPESVWKISNRMCLLQHRGNANSSSAPDIVSRLHLLDFNNENPNHGRKTVDLCYPNLLSEVVAVNLSHIIIRQKLCVRTPSSPAVHGYLAISWQDGSIRPISEVDGIASADETSDLVFPGMDGSSVAAALEDTVTGGLAVRLKSLNQAATSKVCSTELFSQQKLAEFDFDNVGDQSVELLHQEPEAKITWLSVSVGFEGTLQPGSWKIVRFDESTQNIQIIKDAFDYNGISNNCGITQVLRRGPAPILRTGGGKVIEITLPVTA